MSGIKNIVITICFSLLCVDAIYSVDITTTEDFDDLIDTETSIDGDVTTSSYRDINYKERSSFIDSVLNAINNQNWTFDELQCFGDITLMLNGVKNSTLWALWKWESMNTNPYGVLYGTRYQMGNFDQCLASPWMSDQTALRSQYCLVDVRLGDKKTKRTAQEIFQPVDPYMPTKTFIDDISNTLSWPQNLSLYYADVCYPDVTEELLNKLDRLLNAYAMYLACYHYVHSRPVDILSYGVCVPIICSPKAIEKFTTALLSTTYVKELQTSVRIEVQNCQETYRRPFDAPFYLFIMVTILLLIVTIMCTCVYKKKSTYNTLKTRIIGAFNIENNGKNLLVMKSGGLNVLYGIRFLTICLIVLGHQIGIYNGGGPTINGRSADEMSMSAWGIVFLHFDVFVDTFYMMSGLLTVSYFLSMKKFPNPFLLIMKRYIRLAAGLAVVVFYMSAVFSYTGSGPLWSDIIKNEEGPCRRNWWISLLMINNYINSNDYCIVISWYVPTDFQFFLVAVALWCIYRKSKKAAVVIATLLAFASTIAMGVITYLYELAPIQTLTYEFLLNQRDNREFNLTYVKAHTRFSAYYIGLAAGYILTKKLNDDKRRKWSTKWSMLGALLGMAVMAAVMMTGAYMVSREIHPIQGAMYAALNRPAFVLGLVVFISCCSLGHIPLISSFLSWYQWVPLSRLSYGLYLTHTMIILRNVFISRQPQFTDPMHILMEASGAIVWGSVAALLMWLLVEAPANNLLTILMSPRSSASSRAETEDCSVKCTQTNGHFQENLPSSIQISKI